MPPPPASKASTAKPGGVVSRRSIRRPCKGHADGLQRGELLPRRRGGLGVAYRQPAWAARGSAGRFRGAAHRDAADQGVVRTADRLTAGGPFENPVRRHVMTEVNMKIAVVGQGNVGGGIAGLWERAGHEVMRIGRDGGDVSDADAVLVAVPGGAIADALGKVQGLEGKTVIDATNLCGAETPHGLSSNAEFVKSRTGGPRPSRSTPTTPCSTTGSGRPEREAVQPVVRGRGSPRGRRAAEPRRRLRAGLRGSAGERRRPGGLHDACVRDRAGRPRPVRLPDGASRPALSLP